MSTPPVPGVMRRWRVLLAVMSVAILVALPTPLVGSDPAPRPAATIQPPASPDPTPAPRASTERAAAPTGPVTPAATASPTLDPALAVTPTPTSSPVAEAAPVPLGASPLPLARAPLPLVPYDVVVYGGTPSGVLAAVTAARAGARVVLLEPTSHIGGMLSNGLTFSDIGDETVIGGYTAEFFDRMGAVDAVGSLFTRRYHFAPSAAEMVLETWLVESGVLVVREQRLAERARVVMQGTTIVSIQMESGLAFAGRVFIDASYEGDLLARVGVSHRIGREAATEYGESLAGAGSPSLVMDVPPGTAIAFPMQAPGAPGNADARIQNSNFRLCFSSDPENQVPFPQPPGYDPANYELVLAYLAQREAVTGTGAELGWLMYLGALVDDKFDVNESGAVSLGVPGANWEYPAATEAVRQQRTTWLRRYQQGFLYFLAHDPRVPSSVSDELAGYGLCADEFTDTDNWPGRFYLREGRRMVGAYVLTQHDVEEAPAKEDIIGVASYPLDAHLVSRWVDDEGRMWAEGSFFTTEVRRWAIPYRSLTPLPEEATNLLVSVCVSASHVAFASLRMEPQYMIMGEAAGQAAAMVAALRTSKPVQGIKIAALQAALADHGAYLVNPGLPPGGPEPLRDFRRGLE